MMHINSLVFAGRKLNEQDIKDHYKAVFSQYSGQVVACDILLNCGFFDEVATDSYNLVLQNFARWFLKRLGIIREDNLVNMIQHFMGQDIPMIVGEKPEKEKEE
jgi:hypothetical protein